MADSPNSTTMSERLSDDENNVPRSAIAESIDEHIDDAINLSRSLWLASQAMREFGDKGDADAVGYLADEISTRACAVKDLMKRHVWQWAWENNRRGGKDRTS